MKTLGIMVLNKHQEADYYNQLGKHAGKYNFNLYLFTPSAIDLSNWTAEGKRFINSYKWIDETFPIPTFIYDRCFYPSTKVWQLYQPNVLALKKNRNFTFLGHGLPGKFPVYNAMSKDRLLKKHLPPTVEFKSSNQFFNLLTKYESIILKPKSGSQGRGIIVIEADDGYFKIKSNYLGKISQKQFQSKGQFIKWVNSLLTKDYLIQPYLSLQVDNRPFDIRVLLQKGNDGAWIEQGRGIRIGKDSALISNLHAGAQVVNYTKGLDHFFSEEKVVIDQTINHIIPQIPIVLEAANFNLFEIGIDISIDQTGHIWVLEVNSKPGHQVIKCVAQDESLYIYETPFVFCQYLSRSNE
jgi:glutathione synthase/RimK-type ligase-like ATP-grasp enzyme